MPVHQRQPLIRAVVQHAVFGAIAGTALDFAKIVFFIALILFAISAVVGLLRGRAPAP